jgi:hypothetical protein
MSKDKVTYNKANSELKFTHVQGEIKLLLDFRSPLEGVTLILPILPNHELLPLQLALQHGWIYGT